MQRFFAAPFPPQNLRERGRGMHGRWRNLHEKGFPEN
jgi:hypothetical protein